MRNSSTRKKLFFHLGISKTGSSSLQKSLYDNKSILEDSGIKYLDSGIISDSDIAHTGFAFSMLDHYPEWAASQDRDYKNIIKTMASEVSSSNLENFICSSEALSSVHDIKKLVFLRDCFADVCDLYFVIFLRRPDSWVYSWFCQATKNHPFISISFSKFMNTAKYEFFDTIDRYVSVFGDSSMIPVAYEILKTDGVGIEDCFMKAIGLDGFVSFPKLMMQENVTPSADVLALFKTLNAQIDMEPSERVEFYSALGNLVSDFSISHKDCDEVKDMDGRLQKFLAQYTKDIQRLDAKYKNLRLGELWKTECS